MSAFQDRLQLMRVQLNIRDILDRPLAPELGLFPDYVRKVKLKAPEHKVEVLVSCKFDNATPYLQR